MTHSFHRHGRLFTAALMRGLTDGGLAQVEFDDSDPSRSTRRAVSEATPRVIDLLEDGLHDIAFRPV